MQQPSDPHELPGSGELFRRILIGVDSEGLSSSAVVQGAALARRLGATLELVHAVPIHTPLWPGLAAHELPGPELGDEQGSEAHRTVLATAREKTLSTLKRTLAEAGVEADLDEALTVLPGHPAKVLLLRADELQAELIVLGTHAKRALFDFGSTARAVLARTNAPLLIQPGSVAPIERVLVSVDFSEHSRRALGYARAVAERLGASLRVLHCFVPPAFAYGNGAEGIPGPTYVVDQVRDADKQQLERWMHELERSGLSAESTFVEGEAAAEILREAEQADLVVLGTHGRTGLSRFLIGSVAYAVLKHSHKPVLVIPSPNRAWQLEPTGTHEPARARRPGKERAGGEREGLPLPAS